jgi:hypothetical protein
MSFIFSPESYSEHKQLSGSVIYDKVLAAASWTEVFLNPPSDYGTVEMNPVL